VTTQVVLSVPLVWLGEVADRSGLTAGLSERLELKLVGRQPSRVTA
jgi:hypothetical protein